MLSVAASSRTMGLREVCTGTVGIDESVPGYLQGDDERSRHKNLAISVNFKARLYQVRQSYFFTSLHNY